MSFILQYKSKETLGATLLVSGCCIGAGMIGLPVLSALAGFMPSALAMLFCYFFTTATGLLLLETTLWFDKSVNLLSIAEFALGRAGKFCTLLLFLFLFYCLFVAYMDSGGMLFSTILSELLHYPVSRALGMLVCVALVGALTFAGTRRVDRLNRIFLMGMFLSYALLVMIGLPRVAPSNLQHVNLKASLATVPILLICFGYQNLVPGLTYYLKKNVAGMRFAIVVGNLVPFFVYLVWNFVILGMLPEEMAQNNEHAIIVSEMLQQGTRHFSVIFLVNAFSLFAMLTSFLPNAISFVDFIKDSMNTRTNGQYRQTALLFSIVFVPSLIFALIYPNLFLRALGFAGGFIDVLLFAVLPALVVLVGRYRLGISGPYRVGGGVLTPVAVLILALSFLMLKLYL